MENNRQNNFNFLKEELETILEKEETEEINFSQKFINIVNTNPRLLQNVLRKLKKDNPANQLLNRIEKTDKNRIRKTKEIETHVKKSIFSIIKMFGLTVLTILNARFNYSAQLGTSFKVLYLSASVLCSTFLTRRIFSYINIRKEQKKQNIRNKIIDGIKVNLQKTNSKGQRQEKKIEKRRREKRQKRKKTKGRNVELF